MTNVVVRYMHELKDVNGYTCQHCLAAFVGTIFPKFCPECGTAISRTQIQSQGNNPQPVEKPAT